MRNPLAELRYVTSVAGDRENGKVALGQGATGADVLGALLRQATADFPAAFAGLELPVEPAAFKARYAELLPRFEAARQQSAQAREIARSLCLGAAAYVRYESAPNELAPTESGDNGPPTPKPTPNKRAPTTEAARTEPLESESSTTAPSGRPLAEVLAVPADALPLVRVDLPGPRLLHPSADYDGKLYVGSELENLGAKLEQAGFATHATAQALTSIAQASAQSQGLSLAGERFVLFGAGAELSPVYTLLEAGAEVLWLDRERPPIDHVLEPRLSGALLYVDGGIDLLAQPAEARATIMEFARGEPVHFGMYAFAPGSGSPLVLSLTMNEIVRSLPSQLVKSIAFLLSPTSVSMIAPEDAQRADELRKSAPAMRRALMRTGSLQPGHVSVREQRISCAVVPQQGASFQVAEYIAKRLAAEALLAYGSTLDERADSRSHAEPRASTGLRVFAHMAPITATRSLASPLMQAAILGAPRYDIMIAKPSTARSISALLLVHDVLDSQQNGRAQDHDNGSHTAQLGQLFAHQFHGGVHAQPYALDGIVRMAALRGFAKRPKLAFELLR